MCGIVISVRRLDFYNQENKGHLIDGDFNIHLLEIKQA